MCVCVCARARASVHVSMLVYVRSRASSAFVKRAREAFKADGVGTPARLCPEDLKQLPANRHYKQREEVKKLRVH